MESSLLRGADSLKPDGGQTHFRVGGNILLTRASQTVRPDVSPTSATKAFRTNYDRCLDDDVL
jgi:hypothetical protein